MYRFQRSQHREQSWKRVDKKTRKQKKHEQKFTAKIELPKLNDENYATKHYKYEEKLPYLFHLTFRIINVTVR